MDPDSPAELRRRLMADLIELERAEAPLAAVERVRVARERAEALEAAVLAGARAERVSWAKIGAVYGLTKQGAQQRFGEKPRGAGAEAAAPNGPDVEPGAAPQVPQ